LDQYPQTSLTMRHEQRKYLRFPVEGEAMLFAEQLQSAICCHMIDLGLEGCRLRRGDDEPLQVGMTVEIAFRLAGTLFRFPGTIQWSAKNTILGLYFTKMSDSRKNELADLLGAMHEEMEAREKETREKQKQEPAVQAKPAAPQSQETAQASNLHLVPNPVQDPVSDSTPPAKSGPPRRRERREHDRHEIDSIARVLFLSIHSRVTGKVLDLSLGGCRIRAQQEIPVGAYRRVEVEFMVDGLPLLLPGVTTSLHDKFTIGIRFVEMTDRKRNQLQTVIDEISEKMKKLEKSQKSVPTENKAETAPEATPVQA
jgi:PilZ domain